MYNELDSRALGRVDCYAQRFMKPGLYPYAVVPGHGQALSTDRPFLVRVEEGKGDAMTQHNVQVGAHGKGFAVDHPEIRIRSGDLVLWSGGSLASSPFAVIGEHDFFSSYRMVNECGFSHAFGASGDYHWTDAFGSGVSGLVRVRSPDCSGHEEHRRWRQSLAQGTVVMIQDGKADKSEIEVAIGQTVFFAVVKGPGISITDTKLLGVSKGDGCGEKGRAAA